MKVQWISLLTNVFALGVIGVSSIVNSGWMLFAGATGIILSATICVVSDCVLYRSEKQNREIQK